jgi:hypothetical protein
MGKTSFSLWGGGIAFRPKYGHLLICATTLPIPFMLIWQLHDYYQDSQLLEPHMNLVDQCVQGEGLVQINVELKSENGIKKINIVDVLKPADIR